MSTDRFEAWWAAHGHDLQRGLCVPRSSLRPAAESAWTARGDSERTAGEQAATMRIQSLIEAMPVTIARGRRMIQQSELLAAIAAIDASAPGDAGPVAQSPMTPCRCGHRRSAHSNEIGSTCCDVVLSSGPPLSLCPCRMYVHATIPGRVVEGAK